MLGLVEWIELIDPLDLTSGAIVWCRTCRLCLPFQVTNHGAEDMVLSVPFCAYHSSYAPMCVKFWQLFLCFDRVELDVRGRTQAQDDICPCSHVKQNVRKKKGPMWC